MILAKYVAWYSWLVMDAFFDVVANLVPRGKEFPFCMALAYSSSKGWQGMEPIGATLIRKSTREETPSGPSGP